MTVTVPPAPAQVPLPVWAQVEERTRVTIPCVFCGAQTAVIETRGGTDKTGHYTRRRRQCVSSECGRRFTTYERAAPIPTCAHCGRDVNRFMRLHGQLIWCSRKPCRLARKQTIAYLLEQAGKKAQP